MIDSICIQDALVASGMAVWRQDVLASEPKSWYERISSHTQEYAVDVVNEIGSRQEQ